MLRTEFRSTHSLNRTHKRSKTAKKCSKSNVCLSVVGSSLAVELKRFVGVRNVATVQNVTTHHDTRTTLQQHASIIISRKQLRELKLLQIIVLSLITQRGPSTLRRPVTRPAICYLTTGLVAFSIPLNSAVVAANMV